MIFLIVELDKLTKNFGCANHPVNREFTIIGKTLRIAVERFLSQHPEIKKGEFMVVPMKYVFSLDRNRIGKIRNGKWFGRKYRHRRGQIHYRIVKKI